LISEWPCSSIHFALQFGWRSRSTTYVYIFFLKEIWRQGTGF
jgi:hypothetical protein